MSNTVPLDALRAPAKTDVTVHVGGGRSLFAVFALFLLVVSSVFVDNVLAGFRGAVELRAPTPYGSVVQGIFLVLLYVVALHLIDSGIV